MEVCVNVCVRAFLCVCVCGAICVPMCVWEYMCPVCLHILFYVHIRRGILSHVSACMSL